MSALLEGRDLRHALERGNRIGALAIQVIGDSEGLPTRAELNALEAPDTQADSSGKDRAKTALNTCLTDYRRQTCKPRPHPSWRFAAGGRSCRSSSSPTASRISTARTTASPPAAGINHDLGISKGLSSLIGALFFLGYFFFQIPGAIYAERRSVKKLVFVSLILWGGCAALTGMVSNIPSLMVIRFVLGVVEAAVMPAMLIFIANWFTKSERSRANTFLILGNPVTVLWMSVVSGYLVNSFGWRHMFIAEGLPAVDLGGDLVVHRAGQARSRPSGSPSRKSSDLDATLRAEQAAIKPVKNYGEAFRSPAVIKLCAQYFCWSIGVYGFVLWLPSILKNASTFGMVETGWLSARAVSCRDHRDARGFVGIGQARSPEAVRVAVPADRRGGVSRDRICSDRRISGLRMRCW